MKKRLINVISLTVFLLAFSNQLLHAKDTLTMKGNRNHEGAFQYYKNDRFYFLPDGGKTINELRSFSERLIIDPPSKVIVTPKGKKKIDGMKLKCYEKSSFIFEKDGKEVVMPGMNITSIEMGLDFSRAANNNAPEGDENDSGNKASNITLKINLKELSDWMKEGESTPEQKKAFERYKTARETYDRFIVENAALVKSMDAAKGPAREDILNKLRKRKNDEQPLLGELKKADKELLTAFPEIKGPAGTN